MIGYVGFQIAVLGMSNVALEELCGPDVEEFLDLQFSRVVEANRQGQSCIRNKRTILDLTFRCRSPVPGALKEKRSCSASL